MPTCMKCKQKNALVRKLRKNLEEAKSQICVDLMDKDCRNLMQDNQDLKKDLENQIKMTEQKPHKAINR